MTGSGKVEEVPESQTFLGNKKTSDLIDGKLTIKTTGNHAVGVSGTAKKVNNWTEFSSTGINSGHFVPLMLPEDFKGKKVTIRGGANDKVIESFDDDRILITRIDPFIYNNRKQTFEIEDKEVLVVDYSRMILAD